jgi:hypothetical protein
MRLLRTVVAFLMNLATLRNRKRTEIIAKLREAVKGVEGEVFLVGS